MSPHAVSQPTIPEDYLERVYAGVLGKLIGVYLGRPFEHWSHDRIVNELGHIRSYVHEKVDAPLVVTDDDVSGTFQFVRALEEHGASSDLSSEDIGKTWLNNVIEHRTIFWWGGKGMSTEHTAFLNLKNGIAAPLSGSSRTNGQTVAEQIGAQIFIDGWALVAPGRPEIAAKFAKAAGSVSHDGESVYAAQLWAAMEAEAFVSDDVDHLLDVGLSFIPENSVVAGMIAEVRQWVKEDCDWIKTRQRIEDNYGYDKFFGVCHVMPNHAIMVMAILYGQGDFDEAMHIINTCGWDTDCNSGNVGCLMATKLGMSAFKGHDWRGPLADRALISSADGGYSINNAARIAIDIANTGRQLAGKEKLLPPKDGAQFHFTLPGSVQGFQVNSEENPSASAPARISQEVAGDGRSGLAIRFDSLGNVPVDVSTQTFTPKEVLKMKTYELMASPLVYPGQTVKAKLWDAGDGKGQVQAGLRLHVYTKNDSLRVVDGPCTTLRPKESTSIEWKIPDNMDSQPIQRVGLYLQSAEEEAYQGTVWLDNLRWDGVPDITVRRPRDPCDFWNRAWVNGVSSSHKHMRRSFVITQSKGEGIISYGTREWTDYKLFVPKLVVNLGAPAGIAVRVQGLNRFYALVFIRGGRVALVKAWDDQRITLTSAAFDWSLDRQYDMTLITQGSKLSGQVGNTVLTADDAQYCSGGVGFVVTDGSLSADEIRVSPLSGR